MALEWSVWVKMVWISSVQFWTEQFRLSLVGVIPWHSKGYCCKTSFKKAFEFLVSFKEIKILIMQIIWQTGSLSRNSLWMLCANIKQDHVMKCYLQFQATCIGSLSLEVVGVQKGCYTLLHFLLDFTVWVQPWWRLISLALMEASGVWASHLISELGLLLPFLWIVPAWVHLAEEAEPAQFIIMQHTYCGGTAWDMTSIFRDGSHYSWRSFKKC